MSALTRFVESGRHLRTTTARTQPAVAAFVAVLLWIAAPPRPASAQPTFTETGATFTGVVRSSAAWGDYDNDGDLDVLLAGCTVMDCSSMRTVIYRNDGGGAFAEVAAGLPGVGDTYLTHAAAQWGDYDNDNDLDLLLVGWDGSQRLAEVYRNDGSDQFTAIGASLEGVTGAAAWGDFDGDGDLDIVIVGSNGDAYVAKLYENAGGTFQEVPTSISPVGFASVAWGDVDGDGDQDLVVAGLSVELVATARVYLNSGHGELVDGGALPTGAYTGSVAWGDYDSDGDLDLLVAGRDHPWGALPGSNAVKVYANDGSGALTDSGLALGVGFNEVSASWADYDNDGDLDILRISDAATTLYRNDGPVFADVPVSFPQVGLGAATWGDYDDDGRLDFLLTGAQVGVGPVAKLFHGETATANTPPAPPMNLTSAVACDGATLGWGVATDPETPSPGLTYNLRVGTIPSGSEVAAPMADLETGWRRVVQRGGADHGATALLRGLSFGTYYWSVQSVDGAFAGSPFAPEESFALPACSIVPTELSFGARGGDATVSVSAGTGLTWRAVSHAAWITITSGSTGSGDGTVALSVAPNHGPQRSGGLTIAGVALSVTQGAGYTIAVDRLGVGQGTVASAPAGIDCGTTCTSLFEAGTTVLLTPLVGTESVFAGWQGCDQVEAEACTVVMGADRSVTATFHVHPSISVADIIVTETSTAYFTVALSRVSDVDVSFDFATSDGSATAGSDYSARYGRATIRYGSPSTTIEVPLRPDSSIEGDETFSLALSNAANASLADGIGTATIVDSGRLPGASGGLTWHVARQGMPEIQDLAASADTYVAVGAPYGVYTSADGVSWTRRGEWSNWLWGALYAGGQFVVVGSNIVLTSADGMSWTSHALPSGTSLQSAAFGSAGYVAVGAQGKVALSTDGNQWTTGASGVSTDLVGVAFGNGTYAAVSRDGQVLTSTDGISWAPVAQLTDDFRTVIFAGGQFVAVGRGIFTSPDGATWTQESGEYVYDVAFGPDGYVAVRWNQALTSPEGVVWTSQEGAPGQPGVTPNFWTVTHGPAGFVAAGENGNLYQSPDGATWTSRTLAASRRFWSVAHNGVTYCAIGDFGGVARSADGVTWTNLDAPGPHAGESWRGVTSGSGLFVAVGGVRQMTSPDCVTWTDRNPSGTPPDGYDYGYFYDVAWGGGLFVAVGQKYRRWDNASTPMLAVSSDGIAWAHVDTEDVPGLLYAVAHGNGRFVAVGQNYDDGMPILLSSPDGSVWTSQAVPWGRWESLDDIAFANGQFVLAAARLWTSPDGTEWTARTGTSSPNALASGDGVAVSIGQGDRVWSSENGVDWVQGTAPKAYRLLGAAYGANTRRFVAVGESLITYADLRPVLAVGDCTATEGDFGSASCDFDVSLFFAENAGTVSVEYSLADGTARAGSDYLPVSGRLTFLPGMTTRRVSVPILADTLSEAHETFEIVLTNPVNADLRRDRGLGTIVENDPVAVSASDVTAPEGAPLMFVVSLSRPADQIVRVSYATANGTATAENDYWQRSGTLQFSAGEQVQVVTVSGIEDTQAESAETLRFVLSNPSGAILSDAEGEGTILDDDDGRPAPPGGLTWQVAREGLGTIEALASNGSIYVAATERTLWTSPDGTTWTRRSHPLPSGTYLSDVIWSGGQFVVVAGQDVLTSPDGLTWTASRLPSWGASHLAYGNGVYVAVGGSGRAFSSPDATSWTQQATPVSSSLQGVAFGNGVFVAVAQDGSLLSSSDGLLWTLSAQPSSYLYAVFFTGERFVASGGRTHVSTDGTHWTEDSSIRGRSIAAGAGVRVVVDSSGFYVSSDGVSWTWRSGPVSDLRAVAYGPAGFVAGGYTGGVLSSADGASWTDRTLDASRYLRDVASDGSRFCAVGERGAIASSLDGVAWTNQAGPPTSGSYAWRGVAFGAGTFVAMGDRSGIMTSPDCVEWTDRNPDRTPPTGASYAYYYDLARGNGLFVAVGQKYSQATGQSLAMIATSPDGSVWTQRDVPIDGAAYLMAVGFGAGRFVASGYLDESDRSVLLTSEDGATWTPQTAAFDRWYYLTSITYADGLFVATDGTRLWSSPDGLSWTARAQGPGSQGVAHGRGRFVSVGYGPTPYSSVDGIEWIADSPDLPSVQRSVAFAEALGRFAAVGDSVIAYTTLAPTLSVGDCQAVERTEGSTCAFPVALFDGPADLPVTVDYSTAPGTAAADVDFTTTIGTLTFDLGGPRTQTVPVPVMADAELEPDETLTLSLTNPANAALLDSLGQGTISDIVLSVEDIFVKEGSSGLTAARLTLSLSHASPDAVTVEISTADGTATAGADYLPLVSQVVTIDPGQTRAFLDVTVLGDALSEPNETFFVDLANALNATLSDAQARVVVLDDDDPAQPVTDIAPTTRGADSNPSRLSTVGGTVFFTARDSVHGYELWKTDGTAEGTTLVKDIAPGSANAFHGWDTWPLVGFNGQVYFRAFLDDYDLNYLWRSDGTEEGTSVVPGTRHTAITPVSAGGRLFFVSGDDSHGNELWATDGTEAGTGLVKDIVPGAVSSSPGGFADVGGTLFFNAEDPAHGRELWKSDGTEAGTVFVKDIRPGPASSELTSFTNVGGTLFFTANDGLLGTELWRSDGTEAGTYLVEDIAPGEAGSRAGLLIDAGGLLYFVADDGTHGQELWKSDGTEAGTALVADLAPGAAGYGFARLTALGSVLIFSGGDSSGSALLRSDGSAEGTFQLHAGWAGGSLPTNATLVLFADGGDLWATDGTLAGTRRVKALSTTWTEISNGTVRDNVIFFSARDESHGRELWRSDGTEAGTFLVKDILPGSGHILSTGGEALELASAAGRLLFVVDDGSGQRLWSTTGTAAGTSQVAGSPSPSSLTSAAGKVFFWGWDSRGGEPWVSDGTAAGTHIVADLSPGTQATNGLWARGVAGGTYYFQGCLNSSSDCELWKSDGTEAGTALVKDVVPGPAGSNPFPILGGSGPRVFFSTTNGLWTSDGTESGTIAVPTPARVAWPIGVVGERLFFWGEDALHGTEIWQTDGTAEGTTLPRDIAPGPEISWSGSVSLAADALYFRACDAAHGCELWKSDGSEAGTVLVADAVPGPASSMPGAIRRVGDVVYFTADDGVHGREPWVTDGTPAGTRLISDIYPGPASSSPTLLTDGGCTAFFQADDGTHGYELWQSDGTTAGTRLVRDLAAGPASSGPADLAVSGSRLFWTADDGLTSRELWSLPLPACVAIGPRTVQEQNVGAATATFSVSLSKASAETVSVAYATADRTATAGSDYTAVAGTLTFAPGERSKTIGVAVRGDTLHELDETFAVTLFDALGAGLTRSMGIGTVLDDDDPPALSVTDVEVPEGDTGTRNAVLTVSLSAPSGVTTSVAFATADGTATAGSDYHARSGDLVFPPGTTSRDVVVPVYGDTSVEDDETFTLDLSAPLEATITRGQALATIADDDFLTTLHFSAASFAVAEAGPTATITVRRTGTTTGTVTVAYETTDGGTATPGLDYAAGGGTLTFGDGVTSRTFTVPIVNDTLVEENETVLLLLSAPAGEGVGLGAQTTAVLTITDNDLGGTLQLGAATYTVSEAGASATITVTRTGGAASGVSVRCATSGGTATADADYAAVSTILTFAASATSATCVIPILEDSLPEGPETVTLTLSEALGGAALGARTTAVLTINDNDNGSPFLYFGAPTFTVSEAAATATVTVRRGGATTGAVSVICTPADGSAVAGADYTAVTRTLSFASGVVSQNCTIPLLADTSAEGAETVNVALSSPTGGAVLGTQSTAVLTITDNDLGGTLQFSAAAYTVTEAGPQAAITVSRTGGTASGVSVRCSTSAATATAESDYTSVSSVLTFAAGATTATCRVPILEDVGGEGPETLALTLSEAAGGATLGARTSAVLTITDNDNAAPILYFSAATFTVAEAGATATVTVRRGGLATGAVGVICSTADGGTASPGSDYTAVSRTLAFASGTVSRSCTIPIANDTLVEGPETVRLILSDPTGAAILGSQATALLAITDNDVGGTVQLAAATYNVAEAGPQATITVSRTGGTGGGVTVDYATSDGTAAAGTDYLAAAGTLTFASGQVSQTFTIPLIDDDVHEATESLTVLLSGAQGATVGALGQATLWIVDDDPE